MKSGGWTLLLALLFLAALALRRDMLAIFASVLAIATGTSALWARYCLSNLSYRRRLGSAALNYGEETTLTLEFENAKPLPLAWVLVRDTFPAAVRLLTDERPGERTGRGHGAGQPPVPGLVPAGQPDPPRAGRPSRTVCVRPSGDLVR